MPNLKKKKAVTSTSETEIEQDRNKNVQIEEKEQEQKQWWVRKQGNKCYNVCVLQRSKGSRKYNYFL